VEVVASVETLFLNPPFGATIECRTFAAKKQSEKGNKRFLQRLLPIFFIFQPLIFQEIA
jgi:hypothetical protein